MSPVSSVGCKNLNKKTTSLYDVAGRMTTHIDQLGRITSYSYDEVGNELTTQTTRASSTMEYDENNRLLSETYSPGNRQHTYSYDPVGNRLTAFGPYGDNQTGTYTTTYSARNEEYTLTDPAEKLTTYTYTNVVNRRWKLVDPDEGTTTYSYDAAGRQNAIINPRESTVTFTFDTASRRKTKVLPCTVTNWTYDQAGNKTGIHTTRTQSSMPISRLTYTYDKVNNRKTQIDQDDVTTSWSYDPAYQLENERANGGSPYNVTFTYDAAGNRTQANDGDEVTASTYDAANQLVTEVNLRACLQLIKR